MTVSHGCYNGMQMFFTKWRHAVAKAADIPVELMEGWIEADLINASLDASPLFAKEILERHIIEWLPIKWTALKPDILHVLLHHGDDTGIIEVEYLSPLAERLEGLIPSIKNGSNGIDYQAITQKFVDGLRFAASKNEVIEFSS